MEIYWCIICASWYSGRIRGFRISENRHCRTYNTTLADIIDNHAPQKSRSHESSQWELINHGTLQNYPKRNDFGINMNWNTESKLIVDKLQLHEQRNKWNIFLNSTKKVISKIRLKMPNYQQIFTRYAISFWIGNKSHITIAWLCSIAS